MARKYTIELWTKEGARVADISNLAKNRRFSMERNEAETLTFDLDFNAFQDYCSEKLGGAQPGALIYPYATDVKIKRYDTYLFGTQVVQVDFALEEDSYVASVTCSGYLNLFNDRYVTASYLNIERTTIATNIITLTQSQLFGSVGVTIGDQYVTGKTAERNYQGDNLKTKLQQLAALSDAPFDFDISWDKVFRTYEMIGSYRSDLSLVYGGPLSNVAKFGMEQSALRLYNKVTGLSSGFGEVTGTSVQLDEPSALNFYLRERVMQYNSVKEQSTLDQNTLAYKESHKEVLELPKATITGHQLPATFLSVGDRVPLRVVQHKWLEHINGLYRIERLDVTLDDNDFESSVDLTFDNHGVDQDEQPDE